MKRALSLLLAIFMVFSLVPMAAFAAGETTISFETTFTDDMTVGDTFTVDALLTDNELFLTMTLSLKWNEDVVKFTGFNTTARGALETEVYTYTAPTVNHELGIVVGYDAYGFDTNGKIFTANFEIIGSGELGIGLKDADATEFEMVDASYAAINPVIDYSAISGLSVAKPAGSGPEMPSGAPFTAITTDAGAAIAIEQQDDVNGLPYYIVTIPEGATTAYVTAPDQVVMEDWNTGSMQATAYAFDVENGWTQLYISYNYEDSADGPIVEIPMNMVAQDWSGDVELCFVEDADGNLTHVFGIEDAGYACLGMISFRYGTASAPEEPAEPTVSEIPAGAAFVDLIAKVNGEDKPVTIEVMEDHYKVLVPQGTTAVYVVYNEGVPYIDNFGYAAVKVTGVDGVTDDGYSQTTSGGKTTVGLLMNKAAANDAPVTIDLISLDYANRTAVGIKKADESNPDWFSFTYMLNEGEYFAILPKSTDCVGYYVSGSAIASNGYTFSVGLEEGYQADSNFAVKVNGETVANAPGEITLETVSEDIRVTVEGVSKAQDVSTDLIVVVDLTDAPDGMWGDIMIQDNEWNFIEDSIESGKLSTAAITARNNQYTKVRIYEINTNLIAGWDINGTVYPVESEKVYTDYLTIWPRGSYMQVECSSTDPITVTIKPVLAEVPTTYSITVNQTTGGTVTVYDENMNEITEAAEGDYIFVETVADDGYSFKQLYVNGEAVDVGMTNGFYTMPAENITVSAAFEATGTVEPEQPVSGIPYTVIVNGEAVALEQKGEDVCSGDHNVPKYELILPAGTTSFDITEANDLSILKEDMDMLCMSGSSFTIEYTGDTFYCVNGSKDGSWYETHLYVKMEESSEPDVPVAPGYTFATSADISAENGSTAVVHVKITGHSDETVTSYNAYDLTLTFDDTKLEYVDYDGAVKSDGGEVKVNGNTIRIVGCGADKDFGTEIAALTFRTKAEGEANVTIDKVQVSDKEESVKEDAPEATPKHDENDTTADTTPDQSLVLVPYTVTKPGFVSGNGGVLPGETYTFSFTDTDNYNYSGLTVTVGGETVEPTEENGTYTIVNVNGAVVIKATQTAKSYDVEKPDNVTGPDKATYGENYVFTVTPTEGKEIESVKATIDGAEVSCTINENGEYVIPGTAITGDITITVTEKEIEVPVTKYTNITFSGITAEEIEGNQLTVKAEAGKAFTFKLIKAEGVTYTVKVGEEVLTAAKDGTYTIPAAMMIEGDLTVLIEKAEIINVEVAEYIKLDGKSMFLVTAKSAATDSVLKYGEEVMYRSSKYGAYSWLVISAESADTVKTEAQAVITIAQAGTTAPEVAYNYDVNGTTRVDVNDAQLVYDMYNAAYDAFTDSLTMKKFLEADLDGSKALGTQDVVAIINYIVNGAAN